LGYYFGITAASAETPDSFEVFKFVTTTESRTPDILDPNAANQQQYMASGSEQQGQNQQQSNNPGDIPSFSDPPEVDAKEIRNSDAQFADLHNRLQAMMRHISALNRDLNDYKQQASVRSENLAAQMSRMEASIGKLDYLSAMDKKMDNIQNDVKQTKSDLHNALDRHVAGLRSAVREGHQSMLGTLADSAPRIGMFVFVVLGSQALLVGAYLLYKRRKANSPKKYL
jgi:mannose-binding lectin 1